MPEAGCYTATFILDNGKDRGVLMRVTDGAPIVAEVNLIPGWPADSASFRAALDAVVALDQARKQIGAPTAMLRDVPGGWDVGVGNVLLSDAGEPACLAHGPMQSTSPGAFQCETCGALALYGETDA
jgi:hypothetical protein